jgi:hypothetical protein
MSKRLLGRLLDKISAKKMHVSLSIKDKVKVKKKVPQQATEVFWVPGGIVPTFS